MSTLVKAPTVVSWPAAVSPLVAPVVNGPLRSRRMLSAFRTCVHLELGRPDRALAVPTPEAIDA